MENLWRIYGYGWWCTYPSEKYDFVNWDDEITKLNGKIRVRFQTTNQFVAMNSMIKPHAYLYQCIACISIYQLYIKPHSHFKSYPPVIKHGNGKWTIYK